MSVKEETATIVSAILGSAAAGCYVDVKQFRKDYRLFTGSEFPLKVSEYYA